MNHVLYHISVILLAAIPVHAFASLVSGTVTDRSGSPVAGARVAFTGAAGTTVQAYSNAVGYYSIDLEAQDDSPELYIYPNPFNSQSVISFYIAEPGRAELAVYSMSGQKLHVIEDRNFSPGRHQTVWDTRSAPGVGKGVYICVLSSGGSRKSVKMIILGGENTVTPVAAEYAQQSRPRTRSSTASRIYDAVVSGTGFEDHTVTGIDMSAVSIQNFVINRDAWVPFSTTGNYLGKYNGEGYAPFFIKGVNLGAAVPGSLPGQLAISSEQYARWFRMMAEAGFNTVRIYTLHYPRFYEEFARYNRENPGKPLYLLQGVWLNEEYPGYNTDLHELTTEFDKDISDAIDCLHGNKNLGHRYGYAYGNFTADVSQWTLGLIIGREVHAYEIAETNSMNPGSSEYSGAHLSISGATPSETWVAERLNNLIAHEKANYRTSRPVAFSSWPTLDPLTHPSESPTGVEDAQEIDLNKIVLADAPGGLFISYHAYPYYPNFISKDERYQNTSDKTGPNPYLAYIRDLKAHYDYPLLITEFGVPTSWGNARYSPSGMHHGGMSEEQQGNFNMRMLHNIYDTDCGGGLMFSWMDEWFKTTWITHPLTSGRRHLWHNISSPENNYGLIRFEPAPQYYAGRKTTSYGFNKISQATVWHDFAFFIIETTLKSPLAEGDTLWVAFDTYRRNMGESILPNHKNALRNRAEFLVRLTADSARLFVTNAYNMQGAIFMNCFSPAFQTKATDGEPWIPYRWQNDETYLFPNIQDIGKLNIYKGNGSPGTHHAVHVKQGSIHVRIPWTLLHFADPSSSMVIDDAEGPAFCLNNWGCGRQYLNSIHSEGIAVTMVYRDEVAEQPTLTWPGWELNNEEILDAGMFRETEKASLSIIRAGLNSTVFAPK
ncbi:MAG: T9SS type A sorting domain-containing protein [Bacteroidales bacterium]|jgi:hypothetical protein|nr:T9SS type A sorting domain-containing protein [Bacteroidales bacterium]